MIRMKCLADFGSWASSLPQTAPSRVEYVVHCTRYMTLLRLKSYEWERYEPYLSDRPKQWLHELVASLPTEWNAKTKYALIQQNMHSVMQKCLIDRQNKEQEWLSLDCVKYLKYSNLTQLSAEGHMRFQRSDDAILPLEH